MNLESLFLVIQIKSWHIQENNLLAYAVMGTYTLIVDQSCASPGAGNPPQGSPVGSAAVEVAMGLGSCVCCCCSIPPAPPVSCSSTSQTHNLSSPPRGNTLFPSNIFCEGMMLKAASFPLPPSLSVCLKLISR